ncbi:Hypothetical_protein [Hexamita inflata]|uniref:Hypothetical_protein n=1 Tax=Hexamita inflata TaxID=28002 RepID=A0ABP1HYV0_9EUKA
MHKYHIRMFKIMLKCVSSIQKKTLTINKPNYIDFHKLYITFNIIYLKQSASAFNFRAEGVCVRIPTLFSEIKMCSQGATYSHRARFIIPEMWFGQICCGRQNHLIQCAELISSMIDIGQTNEQDFGKVINETKTKMQQVNNSIQAYLDTQSFLVQRFVVSVQMEESL